MLFLSVGNKAQTYPGLICVGIHTIFETLTHGEHPSGAGGTGLFSGSYFALLVSFVTVHDEDHRGIVQPTVDTCAAPYDRSPPFFSFLRISWHSGHSFFKSLPEKHLLLSIDPAGNHQNLIICYLPERC